MRPVSKGCEAFLYKFTFVIGIFTALFFSVSAAYVETRKIKILMNLSLLFLVNITVVHIGINLFVAALAITRRLRTFSLHSLLFVNIEPL